MNRDLLRPDHVMLLPDEISDDDSKESDGGSDSDKPTPFDLSDPKFKME